ncbi:putative acetyltransferase [uncultured Clostridium sp.]|nr:putative acetyltransferase [uncultured Clostridium sp.]
MKKTDKGLRAIPGVGIKTQEDLQALGYTTVESLRGQDPEMIYLQDCARRGFMIDRCQLYVYRAAVYYADTERPEPEKLKWWYWKDKPYPPVESGQPVRVRTLDKGLPYKELIMRANAPLRGEDLPPKGFRFKTYAPGDEVHWAQIESSVGEFDTAKAAEVYFMEHYAPRSEKLAQRLFFALDAQGRYAGTCSAWDDGENTRATLHWVAVRPEYQGKGIARALVARALYAFAQAGEAPVYLHTQTWSHGAIRLYRKLGFEVVRQPDFSPKACRDFEAALAVLQTVLPPAEYADLAAHVI